MILKQSTVYSRKFLMVLTSDHITGATGKTVTVELSKGPGAAGTAAAGTVTELDSTNLPGMYQVALTTADTGVLGDLGFDCTASACDHTTFIDQVQSQIFTDLSLSTGQVSIQSVVKRNVQFTVPFVLTVNGLQTPSLTGLVSQRSLDVGAFANTTNNVTEIGSGWYSIVLTASETNAGVIALKITAPGMDTRNITLYTQT